MKTAMTSTPSSKFNDGDAVQVGDRFGIVKNTWTTKEETYVYVQMLVQDSATHMWSPDADGTHVKPEAISRHIAMTSDSMVPAMWQSMGFRMVDGSTFVANADEGPQSSVCFPVGDGRFEVYSDSDDDSAGSLENFIVPDEECEPFTHAPGGVNTTVDSMHSAVAAYNSWVPSDEREVQAKLIIDRMEHRAAVLDDNARMQRNQPGVDYKLRHEQ